MKPSYFISASLFGLASLLSAYVQGQQDGKKPVAPVVSAPVSMCSAADGLIKLLGGKVIYAQTPEDFFKSSAEYIKPTEDKTSAEGAPVRSVVYSSIEGNWLVSGNSAYFVVGKGTRLRDAVFKFSPKCFRSREDFISQTKASIGKGYRDSTYPPPNDAIKVFNWTWDDPDINHIRRMQVSASSTEYEIEIKIDPAPEEP